MTTHNLTEVEELCDVIRLFRSRMLRVSSPRRLRQETFSKSVRISFVDEPQRWVNAVRDLAFVQHVEVERDSLVVTVGDPKQQNPVLLQSLISKGAQVCYVEPVKVSLEDVYLKLVSDEQIIAQSAAVN